MKRRLLRVISDKRSERVVNNPLLLRVHNHHFGVWVRGFCFGLTLPFVSIAQAELPDPLTLESVLSVPQDQLPQMSVQNALVEKRQAGVALESARDDVQLDLLGRLAWRDYAEETEDFHMAAVRARKLLYDFDRSQNLVQAARSENEAEKRFLKGRLGRTRLAIMQGFFNVLLADFQYRVDNEAMAVAYISFDKAKDRHELERLSDVDFLKMESEYERIRVKRQRSEYNQLKTRIALANLIGDPAFRPDELQFPELKRFSSRKADALDLEALQQEAIDSNWEMAALKSQLQAARFALQSRQAEDKPEISIEGRAGKLSSYPEIREGNWEIGVHLAMPLYDGGLAQAKVSEARAQLHVIEGEIRQLEQRLRDQVAETYFQLKMLKAEKNQNFIFADYADLYLDYSRAVYENESATDLGDAMVRLSQANFDQVSWQFKQALLWAKLDYLTGKQVTVRKDPKGTLPNAEQLNSSQGSQS